MNKTIILFLVLAVAASLVESVCVHHGIEYEQGERYLDDCNWCTCMKDGGGACTRKGCPEKVCNHKGKMYAVQEQFMDECNRCSCTANGHAACTLMAC